MTSQRLRLDAPEPSACGFAHLVGEQAWRQLPTPVQHRFSHSFTPGRTTCYRGRVLNTTMSLAGRVLAHLARLVGAPLPLQTDKELATVIVTDHAGNAGQVWTRLFHSHTGVPQVIQSVKRFAGPTGLQEDLGYGLTMPLELSVDGEALVFTGRHFHWSMAGLRICLPRWLSPGVLTVRNWQVQGNSFQFSLHLVHPWFGVLIDQQVCFDDSVTSTAKAVVPRLGHQHQETADPFDQYTPQF